MTSNWLNSYSLDFYYVLDDISTHNTCNHLQICTRISYEMEWNILLHLIIWYITCNSYHFLTFHNIILFNSIKISESGKSAILQLACGDLRRVLNLLQSSHMSYPEITEEVSTERTSFFKFYITYYNFSLQDFFFNVLYF